MQVESEHVGQVMAEDERGKKRGVMKVTPRLIHTQRQNSLKRHRNAKRLAQLPASHILLAILPPLPPIPLPPYISIFLAAQTTPPPPAVINRTSCCHVNNTPTTCSKTSLHLSHFDFLPVLVSR